MKNIINIIMGIIISLIFMFAIIAVFGITWELLAVALL